MNRVDFFGHIDTKERAYVIGYIADKIKVKRVGSSNNLVIKDSINNRETIYFIQSIIGGDISETHALNKQRGIYPSITLTVSHQQTVKTLSFYTLTLDHTSKNIPMMQSRLTPYCVLGLYHSIGNISFGIRSDRNRVWGRISFTSNLDFLSTLQKILMKRNIASALKPKSKGKSFVLDFNNHGSINLFYDYLPKDMFPLNNNMLKLSEFNIMTKPIECPAS